MPTITIDISDHAIERFWERSGDKTIDLARDRIERMLNRSKPVVPRREERDGMDKYKPGTQYRVAGTWVFIITHGICVTCYDMESRHRIQRVFKRV